MDPTTPLEVSLPSSWTETYRLHIEEIDDQHVRLAHLMIAVREASRLREIAPALHALDCLLEEIEWHFVEEEQFMRRHKYPDIVEHQRVHNDFVEHCTQVRRDVQEGRITLTPLMCDLMTRWLEHHIVTHDRPYCAYYRPVTPE